MVTSENYEEYLMLDADGELDSTDQAALQAFIAANPALAEEFAAWQTLKLQPDEQLTYPDKEALLKREPKSIVLALRPYMLAAAAAVLAAIILIPALWKRDHRQTGMARTSHPEKIAVPGRIMKPDTVARIAVIMPVPKPAHQSAMIHNSGTRVLEPAGLIAVQRSTARDSFLTLQIASHPLEEMPVAANLPQMTQQEISAAPEHATPQAHHSSGLPRIHLAAANQPAFDLLKAGLEARIMQASAAAKSIKETTLAIKIGNGKINLNF